MGVAITLSRTGLDPLRKTSFEKACLLTLRRVLMLDAVLSITTNDYALCNKTIIMLKVNIVGNDQHDLYGNVS